MIKNQILDDLPVFFVAGMPRSGTTWVQLLLNSHPHIMCMGESKFFGDLVPKLDPEFVAYNRRRGAGIGTWAPTVRGFSRTSLMEIYRMAFCELAKVNTDGKDLSFLKAWGEKTPDNLYQHKVITAIFPDARIIHVIKDCRAAAVSAFIRFSPALPPDLIRSEYLANFAVAWKERIENIRFEQQGGTDIMKSGMKICSLIQRQK
jgi:hypothetical protein